MTPEEHQQVYYPDEDSFLLADCILSDVEGQRGFPPRPSVIEVGAGTGAVLASVMQHLMPSAVYATDINPVACTVASRTLGEAVARLPPQLRPEVHISCGDLFRSVGDREFDVVAFNPPYVPSDDVSTSGLNAGLGGGRLGREVIDRFISTLPAYLSRPGRSKQQTLVSPETCRSLERETGGVAYMVCISANDIPGILGMCAQNSLSATPIAEKKLSTEELCVLRITHIQ